MSLISKPDSILFFYYFSDINDCLSNPCLNGANCVDLKDNFKCQCKPGYWGHHCEREIDECALKPCMNNATCIDKVCFVLSTLF